MLQYDNHIDEIRNHKNRYYLPNKREWNKVARNIKGEVRDLLFDEGKDLTFIVKYQHQIDEYTLDSIMAMYLHGKTDYTEWEILNFLRGRGVPI